MMLRCERDCVAPNAENAGPPQDEKAYVQKAQARTAQVEFVGAKTSSEEPQFAYEEPPA
jgi:hypothetical protein